MKVGMPTLERKTTTFPPISSIIGLISAIFLQKMDGPNPSEMDINLYIPLLTFCSQNKNVYPINGTMINVSLVKKKRIKIQNAWPKDKNLTSD